MADKFNFSVRLFCGALFFVLSCLTIAAQSTQVTPTNPEVKALSQSVVKLYQERKFAEALPLAEKQLKLVEAQASPNPNELEVALTNLAQIRWELKKYKESESTFRRLLKIKESLYGANSSQLAGVLMRLGWSNHATMHPDEAENYFNRAVSIGAQQSDPASAIKANALYALAAMWEKQGKADRAVPYYEEWLEMQSKISGTEGASFGKVLNECLCVMRHSRSKDKAEALQARYGKLFPKPPNTIGVTGGVLQGTAVKKVQPPYPDDAKATRTQGAVEIQVTIDDQGNVIDAYSLCGPDLLREASLAAARQWKFKPTELDGKPVKVMGVLTFNFTLQ